MKPSRTSKNTAKLSEALRIPWVKSSLILGAILVVVGMALIILFKAFNLGESSLFLDVKSFVENYGLLGIFLATVLAGTIVPLGSPALVVAAASFGLHPAPLILVATAGFTVGMIINYGLAYSLGRPYVIKKVGADRLEEISSLWSRWGWIIYTIFGLIPVLPVEFLSLFCGLLKTRFDIFLVLTFIPRLLVFMLLAIFGSHVGWWLGII
ncbi:DedA family protein [Candidatus Bathyarchaeota archaeon]|nr:DedA family protein [Candidatus Bathyarchaeota archaeon]